MPKKGKKAKGGKKGKKGKKGAKKAVKDASVKAQSETSAKLWQTRVELAEQAKTEFRQHAYKMQVENEALHHQMVQTERDTIDVVSYLKKQDQEKDKQMEKLIGSIKELKKEHRKETEALVDDMQQQIQELEQKLEQKTHEVDVLQGELKLVKEFRRKRAQMQKELDEIKEAMQEANREQKDTVARMDQKFFDEKMRLEQEANRRISELAERAHSEAIANLDETTRSVYKENIRLSESLHVHTTQSEKLKQTNEKLRAENHLLKSDNEMHEATVKDKIIKIKAQKDKIRELQEKVDTLEMSLSHVVHEFEDEHQHMSSQHQTQTQSAKLEIAKLQRTVELKSREMNRVKQLAKNILDQRTEIERFFLDALNIVKEEIVATRAQYRQDAQIAYQERMMAAYKGSSDYPKVRTFNKADTSTNSVYKDLEAAEHLFNTAESVDISDLTWEQKEKVLRLLFAKMNTAKPKATAPLPSIKPGQQSLPALPTHPAWGDNAGDSTFLTQAHFESGLPPVLPKVQTSAPAQVMSFS